MMERDFKKPRGEEDVSLLMKRPPNVVANMKYKTATRLALATEPDMAEINAQRSEATTCKRMQTRTKVRQFAASGCKPLYMVDKGHSVTRTTMYG